MNTVKATSTVTLLPCYPCPNLSYYTIVLDQVKCGKVGLDDQVIARNHRSDTVLKG